MAHPFAGNSWALKMSFAALVIGEDIRGQLAPFMRNSCNEPEKRYMVFYDEEDALLHWYENGSQERIVMPDGRLVIPWDDDRVALI